MNKNEVVLSYGESLLRKYDVDLLKGPYWLNDSIISFYFEYLEKNVFPTHKSILFVSPEVTQCIKISPQSELKIFLDPLVQNEHREFIFFALNDNDVIESSGGSHWSLLVLSLPEMMLFHFDSTAGSNYNQSRELGHKVARYFSFPLSGYLENVSSLQQTNGYDCGIHVLCNAEQIANYAIANKKIKTCPKLNPELVKTKRSEIFEIIMHLRNKMNIRS